MIFKTKRILTIVASALAFSLVSIGQASSLEQTVNIDLEDFPSDGPDGVIGYPQHNIFGVNDGDVVTINITNATLFYPYAILADVLGSNVLLSNPNDDEFTQSTFTQDGVYESGAYMFGDYTVRFTIGSNSILLGKSNYADSLANWTTTPENAVGFVLLWGPEDLRSIALLRNGIPRGTITSRASNALRLDSVGTTTEKYNVVSCTPGKYTFLNGGSTAETAKVQSYVYTLLVNGKAVSTISSDGFKSVASHLFPTIAGNMAGTATLEGATWDLKGMSNYSAACQVYATQSGGNIQSVTTAVHDAVALAAAAEAAANVARNQEIISAWNAANEELAKKYRDQRLVAQP